MTTTVSDSLRQLSRECEEELRGHILPFWLGMQDTCGGFYGRTLRNLSIQKDAPKDTILHAKILWTFSEAYLLFGDAKYLSAAEHAYRFLKQAEDAEKGGMLLSLTVDLKPSDTRKPTDANAFAIYGLCAYAQASNSKEPIDFAMRLFHVIEQYAIAEYGYTELFNPMLSTIQQSGTKKRKCSIVRSVNTPIHLIEAYSELYQLTKDANVRSALDNLLQLFRDKIYNPTAKRLEVFFDEKMNALGELHSYGHDMEASWLIDKACQYLGNDTLTAEFRKLNYQLANHVHKVAYQDGAILQERFGTEINKTRVWWVEAEGIIGFLNAAETAQLYRETDRYQMFTADAVSLWEYIRKNHIDPRNGGEWFAETDVLGNPQSEYATAGSRKSPYHNSRMCLEVIKRTAKLCDTHA